MNYRKVEAAREVRLWIEHVVFPTIIVAGIALSNPAVREKIKGIFKREQKFSTKGE